PMSFANSPKRTCRPTRYGARPTAMSPQARLCPPHPRQHVFDRTFGKRELLCIADTQHHIRVGPVLLRIEEWKAPHRDRRIGLGLTELHPNVALARIRARGFREHANADLELRRPLIEHRLHDRGHARHHDYLADPEGVPATLLRMRSAPLGMRVMRRRVSFISAPVVFTHSCRMASARRIGRPMS